MDVPEDLRYSTDHEWVRREGSRMVVGITDYAHDALGDVVYLEVPEVGGSVSAGERVSEVESTKSVSDIFAPVAGTVVEANAALGEQPELLNSDPYGDGWILVIDTGGDESGWDALMDAAGYRALTDG